MCIYILKEGERSGEIREIQETLLLEKGIKYPKIWVEQNQINLLKMNKKKV